MVWVEGVRVEWCAVGDGVDNPEAWLRTVALNVVRIELARQRLRRWRVRCGRGKKGTRAVGPGEGAAARVAGGGCERRAANAA